MQNNVEVSIICVTYNQEKYIEKAIKSFLMQKTNFNYEIIIHDDASTDRTQQIIKSYEAKYPNLVRTIIEEKNVHSQDKSVFEHSLINVNGKYIAMCDGDDFWTDEYKLQKQYDALEKNPNCFSCVHIVATCNEDESPNVVVKPSKKYNLKEGIIKQDDFAKLLFVRASTKCPFQTTSYFYRKEVALEALSSNWCIGRRKYFDANMLKLFLIYGDVYFVNEILSMHRKNAINSITDATKKDKSIRPHEMLKLIKEDLNFDKYTNNKYHKYLMTEVYNYLLYTKEIKINEKENKELMKEYNLSNFGFIKYSGLKRLILHFFNDSFLLKKYTNIAKK